MLRILWARNLFSSPYPYYNVQGDVHDFLSDRGFWWNVFGSITLAFFAYSGFITLSWSPIWSSMLFIVPLRFVSSFSAVLIQRSFLSLSMADEGSSYLREIAHNIQQAVVIAILFLSYTLSDEVLPLWEGLIGMAFAQEVCRLFANWCMPAHRRVQTLSLYHSTVAEALLATLFFSFLYAFNPITLPLKTFSASLMLYFLSNSANTIVHFCFQFVSNRIKHDTSSLLIGSSSYSLEERDPIREHHELPSIKSITQKSEDYSREDLKNTKSSL